jgi:hypothetical protein
MPRRRVDPETQRELMIRQAALTALTKHPSWPELEAEVDRKAKRIEALILARTLGSRDPVDPYEMRWLSGFVSGMRWFSQVPVHAESTLERFLKEQGIEMERSHA